MYEEICFVVDNLEKVLNVPPRLSPRSTDFLKSIYGPTITVSVPHDIRPAPTPEEAMGKAQDYLNHAKEKGFLKDADMSKVHNPLFRGRILRKQVMKKYDPSAEEEAAHKSDIQKLFEAEPYQKFFFDSGVVKSMHKEISALPYYWMGDESIAITKLQDAIASIVRLLKHDNLLDEKKNSQKQLRQGMLIFVTKAREFRIKLIKELIHTNKIDPLKLTEQQKKEFDEDMPKEEKKDAEERPAYQVNPQNPIKQSDIDRKLLEHVSANCDKLPNSYKFDLDAIGEEARSKSKKETKRFLQNLPKSILPQLEASQEKNEQARPSSTDEQAKIVKARKKAPYIIANATSTRRKVKAASVSFVEEPTVHTYTENELHTFYWEKDDPLCANREGDFRNTLKDLESYSNNLQYERKTVDEDALPIPFQYISKPRTKVQIQEPEEKSGSPSLPRSSIATPIGGPDLMEDIWNTADVKSRPATKAQQRDDDDSESEEKESNGLLTHADFAAIENDSRRRQSDALQFLMKHSFVVTPEPENSNSVNKRLEEIWGKLGFTIQQKLELLLKYTKETDESQKIGDALSFWEQAFDVANQYHHVYTEYKDFLKYDLKTCAHAQQMIENLDKELAISENSLEQIANTLHKSFGDELIVKKRKIEDLINFRRAKIERLKQEYSA